MLQLRTTLNGENKIIDFYGDEDIKVSISYAEIEDITRKNSVFTLSFKLPGSKNNNDIFNHYYDFNALTLDYEARRKFESELIQDGMILYEGFLRLESVSRIVDEIIYSVTFYNQVGDVVSNIGDKYLGDLDLDDLGFSGYSDVVNHYLTDPDLDPSLSADTRPYVNGDVYFSVMNKGYAYSANTISGEQKIIPSEVPRLNWPFPSSSSNDFWDVDSPTAYFVPDWYMVPNIKTKIFYERIFNEAGYQIESEFMDTAYFNRIYTPLTFSNETLYPINSYEPAYQFSAEVSLSGASITTTPYTWTEEGGSNEDVERIPNLSIWTDEDNFGASDYAPDYIYLSKPGLYKAEVRYTVTVPNQGNIPVIATHQVKFRTRSLTATGGTPFNTGTTVYESPVRVLREGQTEEYVFTFSFQNDNIEGKYVYGLDWVPDVTVPSWDIEINAVQFNITDGPRFITDDTFDPDIEIPDPNVKQLDYIAGINKLFNLLVIPNPDKPKTLRIEPVIDWLGTGPVLDWTQKLDRSKPIGVQPIETILNGTVDFTYDDDEGYGNYLFKQKRDKKFGSNQVRLNQDYRDRIISMDNIFSSQTDYTLNVTDLMKGLSMPIYFIEEIEDIDGIVNSRFKPYKTPPRLLFRSVPIPINSLRKGTGTSTFWNLADTDGTSPEVQQYWYNNNRFITYPWGVSGLTHSMNWNKTHRHDQQERDLSEYEDLYDVYWKPYIEDLISTENRLVTCKMYFEPHELAELDFSEKIFIDNTVFRINRIYNYSLIEGGLADVELIKLTRTYQGHRVRYYDLINCTGGTDLHTSTDLTFGVYAYKGYDVKIDGVCYNVQSSSYNQGYTYQKVDLTDIYQSGCTCTTSLLSGGGFGSFYKEDPPYPTPTPSVTTTRTPTPTPSITPSVTPTISVTPSITPSVTQTVTQSTTPLFTQTPNATATPAVTPTPTHTPTPSATSGTTYSFYYDVDDCETSAPDVLGSNTFYSVGKVIRTTGGRCVEVIGTTTGPATVLDSGLSFNSCENCLLP